MRIHIPLYSLLYYVRLVFAFDIRISKNYGTPKNVMTQASQIDPMRQRLALDAVSCFLIILGSFLHSFKGSRTSTWFIEGIFKMHLLLILLSR